jgi:hypothetical protein
MFSSDDVSDIFLNGNLLFFFLILIAFLVFFFRNFRKYEKNVYTCES